MPQLMPLMWISSSFMIFLLMLVFIKLYYMKIMSMEFYISNININKYMLKW